MAKNRSYVFDTFFQFVYNLSINSMNHRYAQFSWMQIATKQIACGVIVANVLLRGNGHCTGNQR